MYQTILKKFSEDGIHLNDEQDNFLRIFEKNLPRKSFFVDFFKKKSKKGCYVHGDVGRGKTMMLNAIFKEIKLSKCSYHFIEFMKFIHNELRLVENTKDPIEIIAKRIASKYRVVFIDEFQVEDVSDAMIIGKLLNLLSKMNVFIMLTSNAKIENLYKNGLQREKFIKQIKQLEKDFVVFQFIGDMDYRLANIDLNSSKDGKNLNQDQIFRFIFFNL